MKQKLELIFRDVYGGDGNVRYEDKKTPKLERKKTTTRRRSDIGVPVEQSVDEVSTELRKVEVQTFRYQDGHPIMRLGGTHGKLWGALEEARKTLYMSGNSDFRAKGITQSIQVQPIWVQLEVLEGISTETLPQILNAPGRPMVVQQFDVIPRCKVTLELLYPDSFEKQVKKLLAQIQVMGLLNKRRATIESMEVK